MTVIPIVIGALGTITKGLIKGLEELEIRRWQEAIRSTILLRYYIIEILRGILETWRGSLSLEETCCERPSADADVKNSQGVNNNNNNLTQITLLSRPEYWEEYWWLEEICCHSESSESLLANADEKNSEGVKVINLF